MWFSLLAVLFLAACTESAGEEDPPVETTEKETAVVKKEEIVIVEEKERNDSNTFPLTGEETEEKTDHRILSVMVNNHLKARPQSGLSQADIVFEILAEAQITRFLALFHSDIPDTIGPVRSARAYYFQIAEGYDALYTYHGASNAINHQVANSGVAYLDGATYDNNGWLFKRTADRPAPHNSYLLTEGVARAMESKGYEADLTSEAMPFAEEAGVTAGTHVENVEITYGSRTQVSFTYDRENEQFLRSSDGEATIDRANSERIAVENVWIIEADHQVVDDAGRRDIDLTTGGSSYLLQKGQMQEVEWKNVDGRLLPFEDGQPLPFVPGQTWVNVIPVNAEVDTE